MPQRWSNILVIAAATTSLTGCRAEPPTVAPSRMPEIGFEPGECVVERAVVQIASWTYVNQQGAAPVTEDDLVSRRLLRTAVVGVDIVDGQLINIENEQCADTSALAELLPGECLEDAVRAIAATALYVDETGDDMADTDAMVAAGFPPPAAPFDVVDGVVVAVGTSDCSAPPAPTALTDLTDLVATVLGR